MGWPRGVGQEGTQHRQEDWRGGVADPGGGLACFVSRAHTWTGAADGNPGMTDGRDPVPPRANCSVAIALGFAKMAGFQVVAPKGSRREGKGLGVGERAVRGCRYTLSSRTLAFLLTEGVLQGLLKHAR